MRRASWSREDLLVAKRSNIKISNEVATTVLTELMHGAKALRDGSAPESRRQCFDLQIHYGGLRYRNHLAVDAGLAEESRPAGREAREHRSKPFLGEDGTCPVVALVGLPIRFTLEP